MSKSKEKKAEETKEPEIGKKEAKKGAVKSKEKKAEKDKPAKSSEKPKKASKILSKKTSEEFLPVIHQGETTHISLDTVRKGKIIDTADIDSQYVGYTGISIGDERYYVQPAQFQKHILKEFPEEAEKIRQSVLESLQEFKVAWVKFGTAAIAVSNTRLFFAWGYKSFKEYCEEELLLQESAVYEIIKTTKFLMQEQREVYERLMKGEKKALKTLPSYRSIYLLIRNKKQLEEKEKFKEMLEGLLQGGVTVAALQEEIRKVLGKEQKEITKEDILKHFQKVCDEMKEFGISEEILSVALSVIEKVKEEKE